MKKSKAIAIIGCGPAGLGAGLYLSRRGYEVVIYEEFEEPRPVGSGLMLQPTGLSVLHELGLLENILVRGQRLDRILGCDAHTGKRVLDVHYNNLDGRRFGLGTHRHGLFDVLYKAAKAQNIRFEFGHKIEKLTIGDAGTCPVTDDGRILPGHPLVVVANGSGSRIAQDLFGLQQQSFLPYGAFWATLDWPRAGFYRDMLEQKYDGASKMAGVLPLGCYDTNADPKTKAAFFWSLKGVDVPGVKQRGINFWKNEVLEVWPQTEVFLNQISGFEDLTFAQYQHFTLKKPYHENVIFIGDAYHSTSPQLGQGANMAMLDAKAMDVALAQCGGDFLQVGPIYHALRKRQIRIFQFLSQVLTPFYQSDSLILGKIRDYGIAYVAKVPPAPRLMAELVSGLFVRPFGHSLIRRKKEVLLVEPDWGKYSSRDDI